MASPSIVRLLILLLMTILILLSILSETQCCGRNALSIEEIIESACSPSSIWDAQINTECHDDDRYNDELRKKRDIEVNTGDVEVVDHLDAEASNVHYRAKRSNLPRLPMYLYRVLRLDEDPTKGLRAKDPSQNYKPGYHVCFGSRSDVRTQYISTTANYDVAYNWAWKTKNRIVGIHVPTAMFWGVQVLDLRDPNNIHIGGRTAINFAASSAEVLLYGPDVPSIALNLEWPLCLN